VNVRTFAADSGAGPIAGSVSGTGRDLLVLHGGPGMSDYMAAADGEFGGWRTIRYQQRGLRPSAVDGPFSAPRHVADAIAVLDALQVERAVVLGHSWSGHLALQLALASPDRAPASVPGTPMLASCWPASGPVISTCWPASR
jgi:proline iminopeptidase